MKQGGTPSPSSFRGKWEIFSLGHQTAGTQSPPQGPTRVWGMGRAALECKIPTGVEVHEDPNLSRGGCGPRGECLPFSRGP